MYKVPDLHPPEYFNFKQIFKLLYLIFNNYKLIQMIQYMSK